MSCRGLIVVVGAFFVLAGCKSEKKTVESAMALANKVSSRTITLFFESPEGLVPEQRTLPLPESDGAALSLVAKELLKGSANESIPGPLPQDSVIRSAYLLPEGLAVVDVGGPTLANGWNTGSHGEMIAVYSLVQTIVSNFPSVHRVRILVNGQPVQTLAGHIEIDRSLRPLQFLLRARTAPRASP